MHELSVTLYSLRFITLHYISGRSIALDFEGCVFQSSFFFKPSTSSGIDSLEADSCASVSSVRQRRLLTHTTRLTRKPRKTTKRGTTRRRKRRCKTSGAKKSKRTTSSTKSSLNGISKRRQKKRRKIKRKKRKVSSNLFPECQV